MLPPVEVTIQRLSTFDHEPVDESHAAELLHHALKQEGQAGSWEFTIRFVDDEEMSQLHGVYMNDPSPTDIMTFPYDPADSELGGDIVISVETAARNASEHGWSTADELDFLMLHGLLHILGWDDRREEDRAAMLERQRSIIQSRPGSG